MTTDQEKSSYREMMLGTLVFGITFGVWEMMEESATALTPTIGKSLLPMLESLLELKVEGEKPADLMKGIGQIFTEKLDWAKGAEVTATDKSVSILLKDAIGTDEIAGFMAQGIKFFSHPVLCSGVEALARKGIKCRPSLTADAASKSQMVTFELL
jgi:hypothetical protein